MTRRSFWPPGMARAGLFEKLYIARSFHAHDLRYEILTGKENRHYRLEIIYIETVTTIQLMILVRCKLLNINRGNKMVSLVT